MKFVMYINGERTSFNIAYLFESIADIYISQHDCEKLARGYCWRIDIRDGYIWRVK